MPLKTPLRVHAAAAFLALSAAACVGFERLVSDIATRVRYALRNAALIMRVTGDDTRVVTLQPNGWPDGCGERPYRVVLSPYKGDKQVPAADIDVQCAGGRRYYTGTDLLVPRELSAEKSPGEAVTLTLTRTAAGIAITHLR